MKFYEINSVSLLTSYFFAVLANGTVRSPSENKPLSNFCSQLVL